MLKEFNAEVQKTDEILSSTNVAEMLSDDELDRIGMDCVDGFEKDKSSRKEWESRYEQALKLASQFAEPKTFPWPNCANIKYPLLTIACLQFSARSYPVLVPPVEAVRCRTVGYDESGEKGKRAERISKHMSYQVLEQMDEWEEDMDRLLVMLPVTGTEFKKTYFDPSKGRNVSCHVMPKDLVVNYWAKSLETAIRKTHVLHMTKNDVRERILREVFLDHKLDEPTGQPEKNISDEIQGVSYQDDVSPYVILEQHCWLDLDEDGYQEPYVVTVEKESRKVLRISARYLTDSVERNEKKKIISIKPIEYFTKFSFIPSMDGGFYDMGFGTLVGPINETVNSTINQILDAGTLASLQQGFLARGIRLKSGEKKFRMGEWIPVDTNVDDLRKGIFPLTFPGPSQVLFQLLSLMISAGEKLTSTTDLRTGESPGQNQPATTTLAVLDQGAKVETAINKRLWRALKNEYKKLYELNRVYLEDKEYFRILDPLKSDMETIQRSDYDGDPSDVAPSGDPNTGSDTQRLKQAEAIIASLGQGSPADPLKAWDKFYRALGVAPNTLLPEKMPPPPPDPKMILAQAEVLKVKHTLKNEQRELDNDKSDLVLKAAVATSQVILNRTASLLNIAKAEAAEQGTQIEQYQSVMDQLSQQQQLIEDEKQRRHELMLAQENPPMPEDSQPQEVANDQSGLPAMETTPGDPGGTPSPEGDQATIPGTNAGSGNRPYPVG